MTNSRRSRAGRIGAYMTHAHHDSRELTAPARKAAAGKLEKQWTAEIDPEGVLDPEELARRLRFRYKAHMTQLAHKSVAARRRAKDDRRG